MNGIGARLLDTVARRRLLLRFASLTTTFGTDAPAPSRAVPSPAHPDAVLLGACAAFNALENEKLALFEGAGRIEGDEERDEAIEPIWAQQAPLLDQICTRKATTLAGRRARAAAYWLWDGGELVWRAHTCGMLGDRLLAALVADLVGGL